MSGYRTHEGDLLRDPITGRVYVVTGVFRAEDVHLFIDGRCYRSRGRDERTALMLPRGNRTWKREP